MVKTSLLHSEDPQFDPGRAQSSICLQFPVLFQGTLGGSGRVQTRPQLPKNSFVLSFASWVVPQEFLGELPDRRIGKADSRSLPLVRRNEQGGIMSLFWRHACARIEQVEHRGQSEPNSWYWSCVVGPEVPLDFDTIEIARQFRCASFESSNLAGLRQQPHSLESCCFLRILGLSR